MREGVGASRRGQPRKTPAQGGSQAAPALGWHSRLLRAFLLVSLLDWVWRASSLHGPGVCYDPENSFLFRTHQVLVSRCWEARTGFGCVGLRIHAGVFPRPLAAPGSLRGDGKHVVLRRSLDTEGVLLTSLIH